MNRLFLALLVLSFSIVVAHGQSLARRNPDNFRTNEDATADQVIAAQAILLLKRLDGQVIVYRSRGEFEESGKLAHVSFEDFQRDLNQVSGEVEELAWRLPDGQMKVAIRNALASYRDGAYWWKKVYAPIVINASELRPDNGDTTSSQMFFLSSIPYTVAIHWREANKHLQRAIRHFG